jgi:Uma2 family endonuclease
MPTIPNPTAPPRYREELRNGDRMTREEFHRIYEQSPEDFRAELIGGVVYLPGRVHIGHGERTGLIGTLLCFYQAATPGVTATSRVTLLLGEDSEPEPDLTLCIAQECGGQTHINDGYLAGPPELVLEIAFNRFAIDFHAKPNDYARYGVQEYLIICVEPLEMKWFDLHRGQEMRTDSEGICRSRTFPGLWIDAPALLANDLAKSMATLQCGLATPEHAEFVARLAAAKR